MNLATLHELLIYASNTPVALFVAEASRRLGPVVAVPGLGYLVSDAELAREILQRDECFTKTGPGSGGRIISQVLGDYALLNMDGLPHRELRARLADLFTATYLDQTVQQVLAPMVEALETDLAAGQTVDLVRFIHGLTGRMTCWMLGLEVPAAREQATYLEIFELGERIFSFVRLGTSSASGRQVARSRAYVEQLVTHARAAYERPDGRADSIVARLRQLGLSFDEARGVVAALFLVGMMTVSSAVPRLVALLVESGQLSTLRARPELLPNAIDEGLRCIVPVPAVLRSVARETVVDGHDFKAGRRVVLFTYNLFKDPRWFPRPRSFEIERQHPPGLRYLWYGAGPHFCLGFALAQREIRMVLEVFTRLPGVLRVVGRTYAHGGPIPAYNRLLVRLVP